MRVALVHDWLTGMRGGERVLESLVGLFPAADIFTLVHVPGSVAPAIEARPIRTSFIQRLPGAPRRFRQYLPLFPLAVRRFDLRGYDLVLATSHCVAVGARPPAGAAHVVYCFTPMRYAWTFERAYVGRVPPLARGRAPGCPRRAAPVGPRGRPARAATSRASRSTSPRGSSASGAARRASSTRRCARSFFRPARAERRRRRLPLRVGPDAVQAARRRGGRVHRGSAAASTSSGAARSSRGSAGAPAPPCASSAGSPTRRCARPSPRCRAFLFPGEEEFGIAPLEATAAGRPVIAYARGALTETVVDGVTGLFFREQTAAGADRRARAERGDGLERREDPGARAPLQRGGVPGRDDRRGRRRPRGGPGGARRVLKERRLWLVLALVAGDAARRRGRPHRGLLRPLPGGHDPGAARHPADGALPLAAGPPPAAPRALAPGGGPLRVPPRADQGRRGLRRAPGRDPGHAPPGGGDVLLPQQLLLLALVHARVLGVRRRRGLRRPARDPRRGARPPAPRPLRPPRPRRRGRGARPGGRPAAPRPPGVRRARGRVPRRSHPGRRAHRGQGSARGLRGGHARPRRLPRRPAVPRAAARGAPRGAEGPERDRGRAGRREDGPRRAPVRHPARGGRGARGPAGHQPRAVAHHRLGARAQARHRHRAGRARPGRAVPAPRRDRAHDPPRLAGVRALPAGADGPRRADLRHPEVPHDARGHRGRDRPGVGAAGRPPADPARPDAPALLAGRAAPALERPHRGHEPGRAPAGAPVLRPPVQDADPAVHAAAQGQGRAHRLGAGQRAPGRHLASRSASSTTSTTSRTGPWRSTSRS